MTMGKPLSFLELPIAFLKIIVSKMKRLDYHSFIHISIHSIGMFCGTRICAGCWENFDKNVTIRSLKNLLWRGQWGSTHIESEIHSSKCTTGSEASSKMEHRGQNNCTASHDDYLKWNNTHSEISILGNLFKNLIYYFIICLFPL